MAKKAITLESFRMFSLIIIGIFLLAINISVSAFAIDRIINTTEDQFMENLSLQAEGYTESVEQIFANCMMLLNAYNQNILTEGTSEEIHQYLIKTSSKIPSLYNSVYFSDNKGNAYLHTGEVRPVEDIELYLSELKNQENTFITNPYQSYVYHYPVFSFNKIIYDKSGEKKGMLCATMSLSKLHELLSAIKIGKRQIVVIRNSSNTIIYHPDFFKVNKPSETEVLDVLQSNSDNPESITKGIFKVKNQRNQKILTFFNKIHNSDWYLSLIIQEEEYFRFRHSQHVWFILILILSGLSIVVAIAVEIWVSNYFHKKDMLASIYDPLTNLYTRNQFEKLANRMLRRNKKSKFMLVETDIHGFKFINQNYGVAKADAVLIFYANRLKKIIEAEGGILCRGYADHIYSLIKIKSTHAAMTGFKKASIEFAEDIKNYEIQFFPKSGITFYDPDSTDSKTPVSVQTLIGQASFAKSTIKDNILRTWAVYDRHLLQKSNEEHYMESHMEQALADGEFFVMYQPKVNPETEKVEGAEALVRWDSSKLGLMSPAKFIPLFEKNNFIKELDFYVYEQVFKFLKNCIDKGLPVVPVSLNMSRNHSNAAVFIERFMSIFKKYDIPENLIEIEILERSVLTKTDLKEITDTLHKHGFKVAMDDFGSGESSLTMLTNIPVDSLKFDKTFLDNACPANTGVPDKKATNLIAGLIALSKQLEKKILFEGVETEEQFAILRDMNCDLIQGFYFSRPITETEFINYVKNHS